jgi:hypothetical protein
MKRIDKILKELSALYELNIKIKMYKFKDDNNTLTVRTSGSEYKFRPSSDR